MIQTNELKPLHDSRASFYGKANTTYDPETQEATLISYNTIVSKINLKTNTALILGDYSQTTLRHIKEFLLQNGFKAECKKQIIQDYLKTGVTAK